VPFFGWHLCTSFRDITDEHRLEELHGASFVANGVARACGRPLAAVYGAAQTVAARHDCIRSRWTRPGPQSASSR
jgi:hypothetical protein